MPISAYFGGMENETKYSHTTSFLIVLVAYIFCLGLGYISLRIGERHLSPLWNMAVADIAATVVVWLFSISLRNASVYDPYWSVIPIAVVGYWWWEYSQATDLSSILVLIAVFYWGIRLTLNWCRGWQGLMHQDWRYTMLQSKNPSIYWLTNLGGIHLCPTVVVFLCMIPLYYLLRFGSESWWLIIGFVISTLATTIEWVADEQMRRFKRTAKPVDYIDIGLWRYSRHPNYFGEITFWLGLYGMAMAMSPIMAWTGIGVVVITIMFLMASIPMMEQKTLKLKPLYSQQIKQVSKLIPWFRSRD